MQLVRESYDTTRLCALHIMLFLSFGLLEMGCVVRDGACEEVERVLLGDAEPSPDGPTASDVLGLAAPRTEIPLVWKAEVTNVDDELTTEVDLSVERLADSAQFVRTEQVGDQKIDLGCGPSLVVPVRLHVATSDGALDETFDGELAYDTGQGAVGANTTAEMFVEFAFGDLRGWLRPADDLAEAVGELDAMFGADARGTVGASLDLGDRERFESLGSWGDPP